VGSRIGDRAIGDADRLTPRMAATSAGLVAGVVAAEPHGTDRLLPPVDIQVFGSVVGAQEVRLSEAPEVGRAGRPDTRSETGARPHPVVRARPGDPTADA
jgi:hypothetical protein